MRFRSSGLGETELLCKLEKLEINEDLMVLHFKSYKPVEWHLRAAMQVQDRMDVVKLLLKMNFKLLPSLLRWHSRNPPQEPEKI